MDLVDPILARVPEGIALRQQGRMAEARAHLESLWEETGGGAGRPLTRCVIAHSLADAQDDVEDELRWDLAALEAVEHVTDEDAAAAGMGSTAALLPSLHLNLAECYLTLDDLEQARAHRDEAASHLDRIPAGEYASTIRDGFDDLDRRLSG